MTTDQIHRLDEGLINLIAAGEVVERPASVVKELVENCLDAGAKRIDIHLKEGGIEELRVADDGRGMEPGDLLLCVERHTTSKIVNTRSLESIGTFGFRGEALASIAAVATVQIDSKRVGSNSGYRLVIEGGRVSEPTQFGMAQGTCVTVWGVFERVPARQKFLKSVSTELAHCQKVVKELALGNPEVQFFISHNESDARSYLSLGRLARVREVLRVSWEPLVLCEKGDDISLEAFLTPAHVICQRGELLIFVNHRSVRNRNLVAAFRRAYEECLGPRHDPSGVVYLDIRLDWVDPNAHPQKTEVRILRSESLFPWIVSAVRKVLAKPPRSVAEVVVPAFESLKYPRLGIATPIVTGDLSGVSGFPSDTHTFEGLPVQESFELREPASKYRPSALPKMMPVIRYLGQVKASYLLCEDSEGLILIDQHALHEKFRFEELMKAFQSGEVASQQLLVSTVVKLPSDLAPVFEFSRGVLLGLGMDVEWMGDDEVAIRTMSSIMESKDAEHVLIETLRLILRESGDTLAAKDRIIRPYLATVACHSVVRANQHLTEGEAQNLLSLLQTIELGWTCPHGRPVLFRLSYSEMEKYFRRT